MNLKSRLTRHGGGRALLSYITHPFLIRSYLQPPKHQNVLAARAIRKALWSLGLRVEALDYRETRKQVGPYSLSFGFGGPMDHVLPNRALSGFVLSYSTGSERSFQVQQEVKRCRIITEKTGIEILPVRIPPEFKHFQAGDAVITTGNSFTVNTFDGFVGPVVSLPGPYPKRYSQTGVNGARDWMSAKHHALYIASSGLALKGIDLVVEAFALLDMHLTIAVRPTKSEQALASYYRAASTKNITWLKGVNFVHPSQAVLNLLRRHGFVISASASEGGPGSLIIPALHGLIPIATPASGVDVIDEVQSLKSTDSAAIAETLSLMAGLPASDLREMSVASTRHFASRHDPDTYPRRFRDALSSVGFQSSA